MNVVLCGMSGGGKDSVQRLLVNTYNFKPIVSYTSRPKRENEIEGKEYHFINKEDFIKMIDNNELIEYRTYNTLVNNNPDTWYYGIKKEELDNKTNYVVILDLQGANSFIDYYGKENWCVVYINCDDETRMLRAKERGSFDETEWQRRLKDDKIVFNKDAINETADFIISNGRNRSIEAVAYETYYCVEVLTQKEYYENIVKQKIQPLEIEDIEKFIKDNKIKTIFLDIDGVIIHSCQAMVELLNEKYQTNKTGEDILSWNFKEIINTITDEEIEYLFTTEKFFNIVKPITGAIEFMKKHKDNTYLITKGGLKNLSGKKQLLDLWGLEDIKLIGLPLNVSKSIINMKDNEPSLFIDDSTINLLESNATYKIQFREYKDNKKREWQVGWTGNIMYNWW